jgi:hypothetical protein
VSYALGWQFFKPQREGMVTLLGKLHSLHASGNLIVSIIQLPECSPELHAMGCSGSILVFLMV